VSQQVSVPVTEPSQVAEARRTAAGMARGLGFDEAATGRVALVATETATNLLKHAGGGEILVQVLAEDDTTCRAEGVGVEVIALDTGPGMRDVDACLRDGYSTAGSPGTGLGAILRQASVFDLYSVPGSGTAVLARIWPGPLIDTEPAAEIGGLCLPKPGETVTGDGWAALRVAGGLRAILSDGLGHGTAAADATAAALRVFRERAERPLPTVLADVHAALKSTRGAAVALAELSRGAPEVHFMGVGNIAGQIWAPGQARHMVSHNGTLGHTLGRTQAFVYPWPPDGVLVLHSDGLASQAGLDPYPGLATRHPALIAAVLYRDFKRGRDDVGVVVVKEWQPERWL
jgi:anti-sigma regulatory factor (Ser/Thr protein kinase)